jgi:hypothetical protein
MKPTTCPWTLTLFVLGTLLSAWPFDAEVRAQGQQEYPLICRTGVDIELSLNLYHRYSGQGATESSGHELRPDGYMEFQRSARAAGPRGEGLQPGTCAWHDRPLLPSEPARVEWVDVPYFMRVPMQLPGTRDSVAALTYVVPVFRTIAGGISRVHVTPGRDSWLGGAVTSLSNPSVTPGAWPAGAPLSPPSGAQPRQTGSGQPAAAPSAGANGRVVTDFRRGPNGTFQIRSGNGDWFNADGVITSEPAILVLPSGETFVAARGQDNGIWVTTCVQTRCSGWTSIGGELTSGPGITADEGNLRITATGRDGRPWSNVLDVAQQKWLGWQVAR